MKLLYHSGVFSIEGIPVINPEVLPITNSIFTASISSAVTCSTAYVNSVLNLGSLVNNETQNVINDGDSFPLPENIIAEKVTQVLNIHNEWVESIYEFDVVGPAIKEVYRLKLKEPLVDTGSKESQDIIIEDLMNEFAPDWYKNYDDCPNIYEEIKSKFIITRK